MCKIYTHAEIQCAKSIQQSRRDTYSVMQVMSVYVKNEDNFEVTSQKKIAATSSFLN